MNDFTSDIQLIDETALRLDPSVIDVSEVEGADDKAFLMEQGTELLRIDAKADHAIKQIIATIQGRASLAKGKVIAQVQDRFHEDFTHGAGLGKWYASLGYSASQCSLWANAYRATQEFQSLFDGLVEPEKVLACSDTALAQIQYLPSSHKEELLAEIAVGNVPTKAEVRELSKEPEVKLSKAQELLRAAKIRKADAEQTWEEVKSDPAIPSLLSDGKRNPEYESAANQAQHAERQVHRYEQQIADLLSLIHI